MVNNKKLDNDLKIWAFLNVINSIITRVSNTFAQKKKNI